MSKTFDKCLACVGEDLGDHVHEFKNFFELPTRTVWVDGILFTSVMDASHHIQEQLGCTAQEAARYIKSLEVRRN